MKYDIANFLQKVPDLDYHPVSASMWESLCYEGLPEEYEVEDRSKWSVAIYPLSAEQKEALVAFEDSTIELFNLFDIALKDSYGKKFTTMIDYDAGVFRIVRCYGLS